MDRLSDAWFVRLPDGRVLRAANTTVLREQLSAGRIPPESRVRRSPEEEWISLDWAEEFADVVKSVGGATTRGQPTVSNGGAPGLGLKATRAAGRDDPLRLRAVGFRALAEELLAALDNTLAGAKLPVTGGAGVASGVLLAVGLALDSPEEAWYLRPLAWAVVAAALLAVVAQVLVTQMTYTELSELRPATWAEAVAGLLRHSMRVLACYAVAAGALAAGVWLCRAAPAYASEWIGPARLGEFAPVAREFLDVVTLLIEAMIWAVCLFVPLFGPVVVVEEASVPASLSLWAALVRRHFGRLFLYESAALLGGAAMLAFVLPLVLAASFRRAGWPGDQAPGPALCVLVGLGVAPLAAYALVAQVFIFLNVRYGETRWRR